MTTSTSDPTDGDDHGSAAGLDRDLGAVLEDIQDLADVGYWRHDLVTEEVEASRRWYDLWGLDPDEPVSFERLQEMVHPDDREPLRDALETVRRKRERASLTYRVQRTDGPEVWLESRFVPEVEDGTLVAVRGINQDVTERKELEGTLRRDRGRLEEAQRVAGVGSWEWDIEADVVTWSDEHYRILGLDPDDEDLGTPTFETFLEGVHPDDRETVRTHVEEALETGTYPTFEWRTHPDRGEVRWIEDRGEVIVEDGEAVAMRGTAQDVTERKRIVEDLRKAQRVAEVANDAKSQFLANTSHEIRTPMNSIVGLTYLVLETDLTDDQREQLETIEASAEHLLSIINDVLDLSQLDVGKLNLEDEPFDLRTAVEESFTLIETTAGQKGLNLAYRYGDDVPEGIRGDAQRVRQILVNLLSNAVKFTGEGEVVLSVDVVDDDRADLDEDEILLEIKVEDTGKGISEAALKTLFHPYSRVKDGLTTTAEGTGLGLSIARNLVELMGGTISAESTVDEGTTFRFTLPAVPAEVERERPWMGPVKDFHESRFLVVDDNETNREIISDTVTPWGVKVEVAASAEEALERLGQDRDFDLVLVDFDMPGMNGIEFAEHLQADPDLSVIPLVLHTSMQRSQQTARESQVAFADILVKPVSPSKLFDAAARVLGRETAPREARTGLDGGLGEELGLNVLVVEDNPVNRKVVGRILSNFGIEADLDVDGEEALASVREGDYDMVFMDLQMPRMDGLEATRAIREQVAADRQPYIVALTAHAAGEDRQRCMEAGMDDYLSKPVDPRDLEAVLRGARTARDARDGGSEG